MTSTIAEYCHCRLDNPTSLGASSDKVFHHLSKLGLFVSCVLKGPDMLNIIDL